MLIKYEIRNGDERLSSHAGLAIIGALLDQSELQQRLKKVTLPLCPKVDISHFDVLSAMVGLICLAKPDYDAIERFREDDWFRKSLGLQDCPSSATLRQRLDMADGRFDAILREASADLIRKLEAKLTTIATPNGARVPLDIDVSPFDNSKTKKEGVSRTYKGMDGYAPILAYLGEEGYLVNQELREGKQHCQKGTPEFLREVIRLARRVTDQPILARLDAGNDSRENMFLFHQAGMDFLIKGNLRRVPTEFWLSLAQRAGQQTEPRPGKTVWTGSVETLVAGIEQPVRRVFRVTERTIDKKGQLLLVPEIEVETWWTSLGGDEDAIIALYEAHGTSEQFHSELKSDMGLERLPSGYFQTNALVLTLGMLGYNLLRLCGQAGLREEGRQAKKPFPQRKTVRRRRMRTVIQDLMYLACRIFRHARKSFVSFGCFSPWAPIWQGLYQQFRNMPLRS